MPHHERPPKVRDSSLKYLEDIALVEEILPDGTRLFPHTGQLPMIYKAVEKEFFEALPRHYAITDQRADDKRKYVLHELASSFCQIVNACREDDLLLLPVWRPDLVGRVAIAQRLNHATDKGTVHGFQLFTEGHFVYPVLLSGKLVLFATHVFDRFRERCAQNQKAPLAILLSALYEAQGLIMRVNQRESALVVRYPDDSLLALPFEEHEAYFIFTTCLTVHEISDLQPTEPLRRLAFHYGAAFPKNPVHHVDLGALAKDVLERWHRKKPPFDLQETLTYARMKSWHWTARYFRENAEKTWPEGSRLAFTGNYYSCDICLFPPIPPTPPPPETVPGAAARAPDPA